METQEPADAGIRSDNLLEKLSKSNNICGRKLTKEVSGQDPSFGLFGPGTGEEVRLGQICYDNIE